jgi:heme/copper-type cytochrome/quinol oxidase subunit 1
MHSLARRYIKTAILFLGGGLGLGLWMIVRRELSGRAPSAYLVTAHTHVILVGFVMMMILGVALWLFPRPERMDLQYRPSLAEGAYWLVTIGTVVRAAGEVLRGELAHVAPELPAIIVVGACLQTLGLGTFFYTMWTRIRSAGSREREARGERF